MARMYLILAVAGWVWLAVVALAGALVWWRRRGYQVVEQDEKQS